jgi:hypothetical protein
VGDLGGLEHRRSRDSAESRAAEPLLPLRLFRNRVFVVTVRARQDCLRSLVADWEPDEDPRVNDAIVRLGAELAGEEPAADVHEQTTPAR